MGTIFRSIFYCECGVEVSPARLARSPEKTSDQQGIRPSRGGVGGGTRGSGEGISSPDLVNHSWMKISIG